MARMGGAHGGNMGGMPRCGQPVAYHSSNRSPALAACPVMRARLASDQQNDFQPLPNRLFQRTVEPRIGTRQARVMQIDADIGHNAAAMNAPVPMSIKTIRSLCPIARISGRGPAKRRCRFRRCLWRCARCLCRPFRSGWLSGNGSCLVQRFHGRHHTAPQRLFVRIEPPDHGLAPTVPAASPQPWGGR